MPDAFDASAQHAPASVAIALPVYNGADDFEEALLSFQNQTYPNFELVICDNASTDATREIAERFARSDPRFIYSWQSEFLNARDNFLRAYRLTNRSHKYFLWACDDNVWHPEFLEKLVGYMESNPNCSACGYYLHHFGGGRDAHELKVPMLDLYKKSRLTQFIFERFSLVSLYSLMRRTAIDAIKLELQDISDYPDRYYLLQLRCFGYFHVFEEDLLGFRAGGISSTGNDPWVRTVIDMNFGEKELNVLFSLPQVNWLEKHLIALKFTYIALRHNIPKTARRAWLLPAYISASFMNNVRPSRWRVTDEGRQWLDS